MSTAELIPADEIPPEPKIVTAPFTIVIDSREQQPYEFKGLRANAHQGHALIHVPTCRMALEVGDYSLFGLNMVVVERKTKADLYSSISQRRDNFEARLKRLCLEHSVAAVVVEAEWASLLLDPPRHTQFSPRSLARTIFAWMVRWPTVHWVMMPDRSLAEAFTYRFLERFWFAYQKGEWFQAERYNEWGEAGSRGLDPGHDFPADSEFVDISTFGKRS